MTAILILGLVLLATGVAMTVRAIAVPRSGRGSAIDQIDSYGFASAETASTDGETAFVDRLATSVGEFLGRHFSRIKEEPLRKRLLAGGLYSMSPARFLGYQGLLALLFLLFWVWLAGLTGATVVALVIGAVMSVALGWLLPWAWLMRRTRLRRDSIEYELPEMVYLLVVSVEAGVSLIGAMRIAAREVRGPLGEELRLTLQEQNMGLSSGQALENLGVRTDTPGMRVFVRSIIQGELLGISLGQIMRNLADEMRKRRRAAAEERAQKAPIKMVFPLVLLIFPAMMVVLLLPALLNLSNFFS